MGNTSGIKKDLLNRLESLIHTTYPKHLIISPDLALTLAEITSAIGREIALYLDRSGRVHEVIIGDKHSALLSKKTLRRSNNRLCGLRCIHTHPSGSSTLSVPDLTTLKENRLDAMVAIGTKDNAITGIETAFLLPRHKYCSEEDQYMFFGPINIKELEEFPFIEILYNLDKSFNNDLPENTRDNEKEHTLLVFFDNKDTNGIGKEESFLEFKELAKTAGALVKHTVCFTLRKPDVGFFIGKGKISELSLLRQEYSLDLIIINSELSPRQQNNLQNAIGCRVIDRTALILQIFADRAKTKEGKMQVELAQLQYLLPRLMGQGVSLSRLGGGIGTRGPGETKLETDRRRLRNRISELEEDINEIKKQRDLMRYQRKSNDIPVISLVGYTNAGKSTLLNILTNADVLAEDKLFATLDPTTRRLSLQEGTVLVTDTVGFINDIPHQLIAAFRATLEEIAQSDLLLHIVDASSSSYKQRINIVTQVLQQINTETKPTIFVFNKCDLINDEVELSHALKEFSPAVAVSATNNINLNTLKELIYDNLPNRPELKTIFIPFAEASLINHVFQNSKVVSTEYQERGILINTYLPQQEIKKLQSYICPKE